MTEINQADKKVQCANGTVVEYDILVIATGSDALLPRHTPGHDANGVFVCKSTSSSSVTSQSASFFNTGISDRTIDDLERLIAFAATRKGKTGAVVGGGLLGLEAAKAMMDLEEFSKVKLIERNRWVLSRQLDGDAGTMVLEQVRSLGLDVMLSKRVGKVETDDQNNVTGVQFEDGERMECSCICFAVSGDPAAARVMD